MWETNTNKQTNKQTNKHKGAGGGGGGGSTELRSKVYQDTRFSGVSSGSLLLEKVTRELQRLVHLRTQSKRLNAASQSSRSDEGSGGGGSSSAQLEIRQVCQTKSSPLLRAEKTNFMRHTTRQTKRI